MGAGTLDVVPHESGDLRYVWLFEWLLSPMALCLAGWKGRYNRKREIIFQEQAGMIGEPAVEIVLGIPGLWSEKTEILAAIVQQTDGLKFVGKLLLDTRTNKSFVVDVYEHDPTLQQAFAIAGRGLIAEQDLKAIGKHTYTLYVVGPGGTVNTALGMVELGAQLLKAGGIAVKVETAGLAHTAQNWQRF